MDPNRDTHHTNPKEEEQEEQQQSVITNDKQEDEKITEDQKEQEHIQNVGTEIQIEAPQAEQDKVDTASVQISKEPSTSTDEKDEDKHNKETGNEKESSQPPQGKHWKNRKKKNPQDDQIGDVKQWPTPDEARSSRGQPPKKTQGEPGSRNSSKSERDRDRQTRSKKSINWKPLSEIPKSQATGDQATSASDSTPSSSSGEIERGKTNQGAVSSSGIGRGYREGGYRGQPKRRGGPRSQTGHWPRSTTGGIQQTRDGTNPSEPAQVAVQETEGRDDSQLLQTTQDSAQTSANGQTSNHPSESRRYRGSIRGPSSRPSNRWRGGGNNFSRPPYFNHRYSAPRGGLQYPPLRTPLDPEQLREQTKKQIEYYFGVDNLCKDIYLRKNMNKEGWVPISLILGFNRVREIGLDQERIVDALQDSTLVEIKDNEFLRRKNDWAGWTFPPRVEEAAKDQGVKVTTSEAKDQ